MHGFKEIPMSTVAATTTKVNKAYSAFLDDTHGVLTKVHGTMYFMATETGAITEIEPEHCPFLMPLGEIGLSGCQALMDQLHGGAVGLCLSRDEGRQ
jgi:hypothetical protein